jgi:beta-lactamase regulating signal transducer with metallopeptidase domain
MTDVFTTPQYIIDWASYLWDASWQASLIALIIIAFVKTCRFLPANLRYGLLIVAALKFAIPFLPSLPIGVSTIAQGIGATLPAISRRTFEYWSGAIIAVYLGGICFAAVRLWRQHRQLSMIKLDGSEITTGELADEFIALTQRMNFKRPPRFISSTRASIPFAFGLHKQTVVLPEAAVSNLSLDDLRPVLAHELAHLRSWDQWANWCQAMLGIVWWFNPLYHWLSNSLRAVREECRDDEVLASGLASSHSYSASLLAVAALMRNGTRSPIALHSVSRNLHPLASRLARIADARIIRHSRLTAKQLLVLGLIALLVLPGSALNGGASSSASNGAATDRRPTFDPLPNHMPGAEQNHREAHRRNHNHH